MPHVQPIGEKIPWYFQRAIVFPILITLAVLVLLSSLLLPLIASPWGVVIQIVVMGSGLFFAGLLGTLIFQYEGKWHSYRSSRVSVELVVPEGQGAGVELNDDDVLPVSVTMANGHVVTIVDKSLGEIMRAKAFTYRYRFVKGHAVATDIKLEVE